MLGEVEVEWIPHGRWRSVGWLNHDSGQPPFEFVGIGSDPQADNVEFNWYDGVAARKVSSGNSGLRDQVLENINQGHVVGFLIDDYP